MIAEQADLLARQVVLAQEQSELVREQAATIVRLEADVRELKRQLKLNSRNSSRPPSTDSPFTKPAPKSLRGKSGRKPGGQPGHSGSTLEMVTNPDKIRRHEPKRCRGCGSGLRDAPEAGVERRQVFDVPPINIRVVEHQLVKRRCGCGTVTCGQAPAAVSAPTQYGSRFTAIVLYLFTGQFLSRARTAQAMGELFCTPISEGTVAAMTSRSAERLDPFLNLVADRIAAAPVAGFDETGFRVENKLRWVHCARTDKYTLITCHPKRGVEAMNAAGVLPRFTGVAVHDAWAPYDTYTAAAHQLCCAHAVRELVGVADLAPTGQWCWADQAREALVALQHCAGAASAAVDPDTVAEQTRLFRAAAQIGVTGTARRRTTLEKKHNALAHRLLDRQADYLRFLTDPRIPPDNNGSERDIRMIKLRQKVSGCMRTVTGAQQFCALRSYLATAAKQGISHLQALVKLTKGQPWLPA